MTIYAAEFDMLHEAAAAKAGLSDFGDTGYRQGLRLLLDALDAAPPLDGARNRGTHQLIIGALIARLITQHGWGERPELLGARIERPLIITGMPRTGTTALHRLLSLDPQFQGLEHWLTGNPMPRPPREDWAAHPAYQSAEDRITHMRKAVPHIARQHSVSADDYDECLVPMAQSFCSNWFPFTLFVPEYDKWFRGADEWASYKRYANVLKLIAGGDTRRWLLKNPSHLFGMQAMLSVFPDACIIRTHRDPAEALGSLVKMLGDIRSHQAKAPFDRRSIEARETSFWQEAIARADLAQQRQPDRFIDVHQRDLRRDPVAVVARIYDHFGLSLSQAAETQMQNWAMAQIGSSGTPNAAHPGESH